MKIAALALANLALTTAFPHGLEGGAGDHQVELDVNFPEGESLTATKDSSDPENLVITETNTTTNKMQFPAETLTILPSWIAYENSKTALMALFGTNSEGSTQPTFDRLESTFIGDTFESKNGTIFTTVGSNKITKIECDNFVETSPTITIQIAGVGTINNSTTLGDAKGYTYTLTDTVEAERKCGFTYTIVRPSYTVTAKECTRESDAANYTDGDDFPGWVECGYLQYGFDAIEDIIVPASSITYSVSGYKPEELLAMSTTQGISHVITELKPDLDLTDTGTRSMTNTDINSIDASCLGTLDLQQSCKYDELCYFKFHVGPCTVTGGFSDSDDDIVVTPFSEKLWGFSDDVTFPKYRLPSDSITALDNDENKFMRLSEDVTDKEVTAMQLFFNNPNPVGSDPSSLWDYTGVSLHGPAQYRADDSNATKENGDAGIDWKALAHSDYPGTHSYEIIGYMKFDFDTLNTTVPLQSSNATAVQTIAGDGGLKITASSYVRLTFRSGSA